MTLTHKLTWHGKEVTAKERLGAIKGLQLGAEHLAEESIRLVPVEEGTLLLSVDTAVDPLALKAAVSFDTPYAVRQHEEMSYSHDSGRQAKYLETPANDAGVKAAIHGLIGASIKAALR